MVVCYAKKCIFIHIPNTGGTSIEQFIKDNGKNDLDYHGVKHGRSMHHYTALDLKRELPILYHRYYSFSIVRNPYDRLLSAYYWTPIPGVGYKSNASKRVFLQYVTRVVKQKRYAENIYNEHFIPQYVFIYRKQLLVQQLFKYEDFDFAIPYLKKKLQIQMDFPTLNKSNVIKEEWTEMQKEKIYKLYYADFVLFHYSK